MNGALPWLGTLIGLSVGCAAPPDPELVALRSGDLEDCGDDGPCRAFAARELAPEDAQAAERICAELGDPLWRDECWFLLSDTLDAVDAEAQRICGHAGRFEDPCLGHAALREGRRMLAEPGREREALAHMEQGLARVHSPGEARRVAETTVMDAVVARGLPFSREQCGDLEAEACGRAYLHLTLAGSTPARACADPAPVAEDTRELAQAALEAICPQR